MARSRDFLARFRPVGTPGAAASAGVPVDRVIRRLAVAHGAADLLDQKVRVLRHEAERFALLAERSGDVWVTSCRDAEAWSLRASLVGGRPPPRAACPHDQASVEIVWGTTMGVPTRLGRGGPRPLPTRTP